MKGHGDGGIASIAANVKKSNMLAPWLAFGMLSLVVYGAFSDGDFSFLLTYASLTRCFAVTLLVAQLQQSKSASGISSKTLQCYVCVFASRLLSILRHEGYLPYDRSGDWIYHCIEVGAFLATLAALALVHGPYSATYDITADGFGAPGVPSNLGALVLIVPAFIVALLVHPGLNKDVLSDASWTYAMYLESFAVLPQLYLFQKQARRVATVDYLVGHFVAALGFSPVWKSTTDRNGNRHVGVLVLVAQMVHLVIMGDFFYFYLRSVKKGLPIQLPSPSSANMV